jgi:hypothetical protein
MPWEATYKTPCTLIGFVPSYSGCPLVGASMGSEHAGLNSYSLGNGSEKTENYVFVIFMDIA